jgi:hypothetical protein
MNLRNRRAIDLINDARARGLDVTFDVYPYEESPGSIRESVN